MVRKQFGSIKSERMSKAKPFVKWAGGKGWFLKNLETYLPKDSYNRYFEPFVGGGAVFFHLEPDKAIINDSNQELINVYEVVKNNVESLMNALDKHQKNVDNKDYYYSERKRNPNLMNPINRAARTIFLNKTCFNGIYRVNSSGKFNVPFGDMKKAKLYVRENMIECSRRLSKATILAGDYKKLLRRIKKDDFIYLDPPYVPISDTAHFTSYTKEGFREKDQRELRDFCRKIDLKGAKFLLNNSYTDLIKELFEEEFNKKSVAVTINFRLEKAKRSLAAKSSSREPVYECVITNY